MRETLDVLCEMHGRLREYLVRRAPVTDRAADRFAAGVELLGCAANGRSLLSQATG